MFDLPPAVDGFLHGLLLGEASPSYLEIGPDNRLASRGGDLAAYGLADLVVGGRAAEQVLLLEGLLPHSGPPLRLDFIELPSGRVAHVHLFVSLESTWVLLLDATTEEERHRQLQQRSNDLTLLQQREARLIQDLEARNQMLAEREAHLAELNELKNEFLGMAAHDLRSPIGVVSGYAGFLLTDLEAVISEQHMNFVRHIQESSEFMAQMLDELLDVNRIESGTLQVTSIPVDLNQLVEHNLLLNRMLAEQKDIRIDFAPVGGLPAVSLDQGKIEQVLSNLVSNAIKDSAPGTTTTVALEQVGESVRVVVRDQGQGIPAEEQAKLFLPFSKLSVKPTGDERSIGLGLAICKRIVEAHAGTIGVESTVGEGSSFFFLLPLAPPAG